MINCLEKIKNFLEKETGYIISDRCTNLIETGIVDSFSMIKLLDFIEKEFNVKINMEELSPENFYSLESMVVFVEKLDTKR